jgi:hypothetical protein
MKHKPQPKWVPGLREQYQIVALLGFDQATITHQCLRLFLSEGLVARDSEDNINLTARGRAVVEYLNAP